MRSFLYMLGSFHPSQTKLNIFRLRTVNMLFVILLLVLLGACNLFRILSRVEIRKHNILKATTVQQFLSCGFFFFFWKLFHRTHCLGVLKLIELNSKIVYTVPPKGKLPVASCFARYANRVARESLKRQFWHKLGTIYR